MYCVYFCVTDTGIGIPANKLKQVFDSFTQADTETTRKYGGTGLGLAISKYIVEKMGGELQVESEEGKGSSFYFYDRLQGECEESLCKRRVTERTYRPGRTKDSPGRRQPDQYACCKKVPAKMETGG